MISQISFGLLYLACYSDSGQVIVGKERQNKLVCSFNRNHLKQAASNLLISSKRKYQWLGWIILEY